MKRAMLGRLSERVLLLAVSVLIMTQVYAQQEAVMRDFELVDGEYGPKHHNERRLSADGDEMMHMHLFTTPLYGNSTDFMYYYITMYFGSHR